ncbi:hypothetical protein [Streptomyces sulphureus]|uniref:hypothetical protein n=1 Tax=Streptomyces sulphureus TaxID=47758 RepID=UPI000475FB54
MSIATRQDRMPSPSRRTVRTAVAVGTASLGLLALSGCSAPTPVTTATVGGNSVSSEASCYNDGKALAQSKFDNCLKENKGDTFAIGTGDKLRVGVEPDVAETGWSIYIDGQPVTQPINKTYYSLPGEAFFQQQSPTGQTSMSNQARLAIVETDGSTAKGVWHLKLKNES